MKKMVSLLIGFVIAFSGMHLMPDHAMAKGMDAMHQHCSMCPEEDQNADDCLPPVSGTSADEETFDNSLPFDNNCECTVEQNEKNHHAGILPLNSRHLKQKMFTAVLPQAESIITDQTFLTVQKINAPPSSYLSAYKTVQKLE